MCVCAGVQGEVGQIVADRHVIAMEMDRVSGPAAATDTVIAFRFFSL